MRRDELTELHYICSIDNVPSIRKNGLLSHQHAAKYPHTSVAMEEVQAKRAEVVLHTRRKLHEHVNLYLNARNVMMYKRKDRHLTLCVLRISTDVLDRNGVMMSDRNAASRFALIDRPSEVLAQIDKRLIFAHSWIHEDGLETLIHRSQMCAEVLVPDRVEPAFILGAYVSCEQAKVQLLAVASDLLVVVNSYMFFR